MKFFTQSPDAEGRIDPPVHNILNKVPGTVHSAHEADVILVPVTVLQNFRMADLKLAHKPWVLADFCELGWDWDQRFTHRWGRNTSYYECFHSNREEWEKLDRFVQENPPTMEFIRELLTDGVAPNVQPIDYLCNYPIPVPQTRVEFNARPLDLLYYWGRSSEHRMKLHGDIFSQARYHGYDIISQFDHVSKWQKHGWGQKAWISVHAPWYSRTDMMHILEIQGTSKVSVSMPGAGVKTFRDADCPINALMAKPLDFLARAFPWSSANALIIDPVYGNADAWVRQLAGDLQTDTLYDRYRAGVENACRYAPDRYFKEHFIPKLEAVL